MYSAAVYQEILYAQTIWQKITPVATRPETVFFLRKSVSKHFLRKSVSKHFLRKSVSNGKVSRIYMKQKNYMYSFSYTFSKNCSENAPILAEAANGRPATTGKTRRALCSRGCIVSLATVCQNIFFAKACQDIFFAEVCQRKSIEDLCEKFSNSLVFGKGLRKTAARTLLFSSGAVSGRGWRTNRPGWVTEKEPPKASFVWGIFYEKMMLFHWAVLS